MLGKCQPLEQPSSFLLKNRTLQIRSAATIAIIWTNHAVDPVLPLMPWPNRCANTKAPQIHSRSTLRIANRSLRFINDRLLLYPAVASAAEGACWQTLFTVAVLIRWRVTVNNAC